MRTSKGKLRVDELLVARGLAENRTRAHIVTCGVKGLERSAATLFGLFLADRIAWT